MVTVDDLDGVDRQRPYPDGTVVRVFCLRTADETYRSGWAYTLNYGTTDPDAPRSLDDGTIRRYDNSHEDTKSHELHVAPDSEPRIIEFPGIVALWNRFWSEIPKPELDVREETSTMHPKQREYRQRDDVSTLVVTVETDGEFHDETRESLHAPDRGNTASANGMPVLSFTSYEQLLGTFTPWTLELIETVRQERPTSINDTARVVGRDVKNVHDELAKLGEFGVLYFEENGQSKRPVVWFDELDIRLSIDGADSSETERVRAD